MSFENDSDYRKLENFENSSVDKSDKSRITEHLPSQHLEPHKNTVHQSESDQFMQTYANEMEMR